MIEQEDGILAVGSGGDFAYACAKGLIDIEGMEAKDIALKSMYEISEFTYMLGKSQRIFVCIRTVILLLKNWINNKIKKN